MNQKDKDDVIMESVLIIAHALCHHYRHLQRENDNEQE